MGVQGGKGDCSTEVSALAFGHWHVAAIEMFLGQAEVYNVDLPIFFIHNKIRGFDISVNETTLMDTVDSSDHLHQDLNGHLEIVALVQASSGFSQVDA